MLSEAVHWALRDWNWVWIWVLWGVIASLFEGVRDFFLDGWRQVMTARKEAEIELTREKRKLTRAEADLAAAQGQPAALPKPGPCVHRRVVPVIAAGEDAPSAWLCKNCEEQLPADWAVRKEDL